MSIPKATLYYVHDPMCSWCWGFQQSWQSLRQVLPDNVSVINVVGGLAPDSDQPMPVEQQKTICGYWEEVSRRTGAQFNFDFWQQCTPRRSTYPACRAVLAAGRQHAEQAMIDAIAYAYYLRAMNPSDNCTLITLAGELGLDTQQFSDDLVSSDIEDELQRHFALRRDLGVRSFPSLVLTSGNATSHIAIDYASHLPMLQAIADASPE